MTFQTVLSIVGIAFTAFELYQRFRQKERSGGRINTEHNSAQNTISPRAEPKHGGAERRLAKTREAPSVQKSEWCDNNDNLFFSYH